EVDGILHFAETLTLDAMAEQCLTAEVVPSGIEFEGAAAAIQSLQFRFEPRRIAGIHAHPGQYASEVLYVLLGVTAVHSERVEFHELPSVIFIDVSGGVLVVVQILQHGGMFERRQD